MMKYTYEEVVRATQFVARYSMGPRKLGDFIKAEELQKTSQALRAFAVASPAIQAMWREINLQEAEKLRRGGNA